MQINAKDLRGFLIDPNETVINTIGDSFIANFLATGVIGKGFAILTNKRVYFKGECLTRQGKRFKKNTEERVVDLEDVTGTGFVHTKPIWLIVTAILFAFFMYIFLIVISDSSKYDAPKLVDENNVFALVLVYIIIIPAIFIFAYFKTKKTLFEISYAGGGIAFDLKLVTEQESINFQRSIRMEKDKQKAFWHQQRNAYAQAAPYNNVYQGANNQTKMNNAFVQPASQNNATQGVNNQAPLNNAYPQVVPQNNVTEVVNNDASFNKDQILQYKELLDKGAITQEEFETLKKKLLNL